MTSTQKSITRKNMPPDDPGRTPYTNEAVPYEEVDEIIEKTWLSYQSVENALIASWRWIDSQENNAWLHPKNVLVDISSSEGSKSSGSSGGSSGSSGSSSKPSSDSSGSSKSGSSPETSSGSGSGSTSSSTSSSSSSPSSSSRDSPVKKRPRVDGSSSDDGDEPTPGHLWPDTEDEAELQDYENEMVEEPYVENPKHSIFNRKYVVEKYEEHATRYIDELVQRGRREGGLKWDAPDVARLLHTRRISLKMRKYMYELKELKIPFSRVSLEIGNDYIFVTLTFLKITNRVSWVMEFEYWRKGIDKGRWCSKTDFDGGRILVDQPHFDNNSKEIGPIQDLIFLCRKVHGKSVPDLMLTQANNYEPADLNMHTVFERLNRMVRDSGERLRVKQLRMWIKGFVRSHGYDNINLRKVLKCLEPKTLQQLNVRNFHDRPRELGDFVFLPRVVKTMQWQQLHTLNVQFDKVLHNWEAYRRVTQIYVWALNVKDMEDIIDIWCAKPIERGQGTTIHTREEINEYQFVIMARNNEKYICSTGANQKSSQDNCRLYFQAKQGWVIGMIMDENCLKICIVWPENRNHYNFPDPLPPAVTGRVEPKEPMEQDPAPSTSASTEPSKKSKKKKDKKKTKKSKKSKETKGKR